MIFDREIGLNAVRIFVAKDEEEIKTLLCKEIIIDND